MGLYFGGLRVGSLATASNLLPEGHGFDSGLGSGYTKLTDPRALERDFHVRDLSNNKSSQTHHSDLVPGTGTDPEVVSCRALCAGTSTNLNSFSSAPTVFTFSQPVGPVEALTPNLPLIYP